MDSKIVELHSLARSLAAKFELGGASAYIDEAIALDRKALALSPPDHSIQLVSLNQLAVHLSDRYGQLGAVTDIDEAIVLGRDALALCSPEHPNRSMVLNNLAVSLATRYAQLGETRDLEEAIGLGKDALVLRPPGHPNRLTSLNNVAIDLCVRYQRLGKMEDLDDAIVLCRGALALCPTGHQNRCLPLNNLVRCLSVRYLQLKGMEDLDEAIIFGREALALRPRGHTGRLLSLNNLSASLFTRYDQLGDVEDVNEAIIIGREALVLSPPGHPNRPMTLNNVAMYLSALHRQLRKIEDIDEAIILDRDALNLRPPGHPGRSISLTNLAVRLSMRYEQLDRIEDLDEAIMLGRAALALFPSWSPYRSQALEYLANYLYFRLKRSNQLQDKEELFNLYTQMVHTSQYVSSADLSTAKVWTRVAEHFHHPTTLLSYETSLHLLVRHLTVLPSLPQHLDVLKNLTSSLAVDAFSACLRHHSPTKAIELLEQGRGVFWSQISRFRSPLEDVMVSGAEGMALVNEFKELTSLIRDTLGSPGVDQHDRVCHLNVKLHKVVTCIRELPGLSRFLLPSLFSELQQAASGGPVIIVNASTYSCDALVVLLDRDPVHIPFQITRERIQDLSFMLCTYIVQAEEKDITNHIAILLREVWHEVVSPVMDFLQTIHPPQSRIWWCPTAEFTLLPLHAAGPYKNGEKRLSDFYISSYTPTLTALIRARRNEPMDSASQWKRFVGIGQAKAKGMSECELHAVGEELANVGQRVNGLATFTCIEGPDACIARVVQELNQAQWVHLACHGLPSPAQPFQSAFALHDGHFTIEHINRCELRSAQFAYLSACHTTVGDADSPDEMIHLASAMQFAGFRSVIGTMWAVDDDQAKKISSTFYDCMVDPSGGLDHTHAAFALHKTIKKAKGISFDQRILYVHIESFYRQTMNDKYRWIVQTDILVDPARLHLAFDFTNEKVGAILIYLDKIA